ncbi:hypothetical protein ElyMa_001615600, partial [Elysia marginata]
MEKKFEKADTYYVLRLDEEHRVRYKSKLQDIGGFDPYAKLNQKEKWSKDIHSIPSISYGDIFNYLVYVQRSINKVEPEEGYKIDLTTAQERKKQLVATIENGQSPSDKRALAPLKINTPAPTQNQLDGFFDCLKGTSAAILNILPGHCQDFKDPVEPVLLPRPLSWMRDQSSDSLDYEKLVT